MTTENIVRAFAGGFILVSLLLAYFASPHWLWFTVFVGINLFQSSFTGFCPLEMIIRRVKAENQEQKEMS